MINSAIYQFRKWRRIFASEYKHWLQLIQFYHKLLIAGVLKHPAGFILWPSTLFFVLSYPALYSLYATPISSPSFNIFNSQFIKSVTIDPIINKPVEEGYFAGTYPDFTFRNLWIQPNLVSSSKNEFNLFENEITQDTVKTLDKEFLMDILQLQQELFEGLDLYSNENPNGSVYVHTPLDYWDNNATQLMNDENVLRTIHSQDHKKSSVGLPLDHLGLFSGIVKVDGLIKSADALQICIFYGSKKSVVNAYNDNIKEHKRIEEIWNQNIEKIENKTTDKFSIFRSVNDEFESNDDMAYSRRNTFKLIFKTCNSMEALLITISPTCLLIYVIISLTNIHSVKSRAGLMLAFVVELTLSIFASATITSYFYRTEEILMIPYPVVLSIILIVSIENMFRFVVAVSKTPEELSLLTRMNQAIAKSGPVSTTNVVIEVFILLLVSPFVAIGAKKFCLFVMLSIIFDHILHLTYFAAVLSIDIRRLELDDLLQRSSTHHESPSVEKINLLKPLGNGSILSSTLFGNLGSTTGDISYKRTIGLYLLKVKLPLFTTVERSILVLLFMLSLSLKWTNGIQFNKLVSSKATHSVSCNDDSIKIMEYPIFNLFLDMRGFAYELSTIYQAINKKKINELIISIDEPAVAILTSSLIINNTNDGSRSISFDLGTTYKFDIYYVFEFFSCLLFVLSSAFAALKYSVDKEGFSMTNGVDVDADESSKKSGLHHPVAFHSKDLTKGHFLDIVKISTSTCPFIVSIGMDHKILVWSPMTSPLPPPTQLPVSGRFLPINDVVMSTSGSLIIVFSKSGVVKCWSRLSMSWVWTLQIPELANTAPLECFFRKKIIPTNSTSRKKASGTGNLTTRKSKLRKESTIQEDPDSAVDSATPPPSSSNQITSTATDPTKKKLKSRGRTSIPAHQQQQQLGSSSTLLQHNRSLSIDSTFNRSTNLSLLSRNTNKEFVIVLKHGEMLTINCEDGSVERTVLTNLEIVKCKKLSSPRVNDRLVCISSEGSLVVATVVNNKWKVRNTKIQTESYNSGKSLVTPAVISRSSSMNMKSLEAIQQLKNHMRQSSQVTLTNANYPVLNSENGNSVSESNPYNNLTSNEHVDYSEAVLVTVPFVGMIVRACGLKCELIDVQTGTLVKEILIGQFKKSTLQVFYPEPSHCRFCGCASVTSFSIAYTELETNTLIAHTFSIDNKAKNSICLRVERDPRETRCLGFASVSEHQHWLSNVEGWCATDLNMLMGVRRKEKEDISNASDKASYSSSFNLLQKLNVSEMKNRRTKQSNNFQKYPKLSDIWEGWTMSATGHVRYYDIPDGDDSGLLIKKLGPVRKFGHKSIIVSFGNIMKILYLGNDKLIEEGDHDTEGLSPASQTSTSLSFINRRRKMRLMKYELTHSTNFNDSPERDSVETSS